MSSVLALFEDPEGPSARLRFHQFRAELDAQGVAVQVQGIPRSWSSRRRLWRRAEQFDVTYVQRRLLPSWQVRRLRRRARRLVFDLDDALG